MDIILGIATLVASIVIGLLQLRQADRMSRLEGEMHRMQSQAPQPVEIRQTLENSQAPETNHSLNMLFLARDAAIVWQRSQIFLMEYMRRTENPEMIDWSLYASRQADLTVAWAEIRGLALIINDETLNTFLNEGKDTAKISGELDFRNKAQKIQTRLAELIAQEIAKKE